MVALADKYLGRGVYGLAEAARLTRVSSRTVAAWFKGRFHDGIPAGRGPVLKGEYSHRRVISFLDLIEVLVAGQLRDAGVHLATIRKAHGAIASFLKTKHPFSRGELVTEGSRIFVRTAKDLREEELLEAIERQQFFPKVMLPYLRRINYHSISHLALSWEIEEGIILDPTRRLGKPILKSSALPTAVLAAAYDANDRDSAAVGRWYGVPPNEVEEAVAFEGRLAKGPG